ncbi:histidine triad nucleotide-binding protein [Poseidonocella sedimentorum]|uniref:Histidine triad (HIT) family protein n=1 Tax=Poseidonocella sedimentorum TaxID=871652 RepID=A0A1I6D7G8_9RHOB|nr:histidine triad nucleotide-binding protein [Poseidonocella sedimentorum]SFR01311.1 histidine triad (HIT) family protein [Poseidonocella sedimentorum]
MAYVYDDQNVFAKILRGEIPCNKVLETEHSLAFADITPQAPVHLLVIPKGPYVCYAHFAEEASDEEIVDFTRTVGEVCRDAGVVEPGYRLISNARQHGHQEVPHLHVHVLGGRALGPMLHPAG